MRRPVIVHGGTLAKLFASAPVSLQKSPARVSAALVGTVTASSGLAGLHPTADFPTLTFFHLPQSLIRILPPQGRMDVHLLELQNPSMVHSACS